MGTIRVRNPTCEIFDSGRSIFLMAPLLALLSFVPSWLLARAVAGIVDVLGYESTSQLPSFHLGGIELAVAVLFGPLFETFLLAAGLWVICRFFKRPWIASLVSGLVWALVHGYQAPLWAVGTIWPFMVFSMAYLAWRPRRFSDAIGVAWLSHSIHNALAVGISFIL